MYIITSQLSHPITTAWMQARNTQKPRGMNRCSRLLAEDQVLPLLNQPGWSVGTPTSKMSGNKRCSRLLDETSNPSSSLVKPTEEAVASDSQARPRGRSAASSWSWRKLSTSRISTPPPQSSSGLHHLASSSSARSLEFHSLKPSSPQLDA